MLPVTKKISLYEQDILLWVEDTIAKLQNRDFENLDVEHLIEEVESLGISQRKELISRLIVILEHLLKRLYVNSPHDYHGWERTIRTQRNDLEVLMEQVPSLKTLWDQSFDKAWKIALKTVREEYHRVNFPTQWPHSRQVEAILNEKFWEHIV
ncbi:MAG: DUF29 domain-containing protein [Prochlorotrichaceae cyanobacterium]